VDAAIAAIPSIRTARVTRSRIVSATQKEMARGPEAPRHQ